MIASHVQASPERPVSEGQAGLLRLALKLDALATAALAVLALAAAPLLEQLLGTPAALLWPTGVVLLVYAAVVWVVGSQARISRRAAWSAVGLNLLWVAASAGVVAGGWLPLTVAGAALVVVQALAVLVFADLQIRGLRRARPAAA